MLRMPSLSTDELQALGGVPYADLATAVVARFVDDIAPAVLAELVAAAYGSSTFDHPEVVSMTALEPGLWLAGLSHGPTLAFKDMALQLVGQLFEHTLAERGQRLTVLGATSGDTGSSAEHAMIGMLPLFTICDRWDVGGVSTAMHADTGHPTIFIYDGYPGGTGIAELGYDVAGRHLVATLELLERCSCDDGCPSCVVSPKCGNGNEPLDKAAAMRLLRLGC